MCRQTWRYVEQGAKGTVNFAGLVAVAYPGASLAGGQRQCQTQESQQRHTHSLRHFHSTRGEAALCMSLPNRKGESQATKFYQLYFSTKLIQGESMKLSVLRLKTRVKLSHYTCLEEDGLLGLSCQAGESTHESLVNVEKCGVK